ncbi:hypothetical protein ACIBEJ_34705 [Nonomuraea sp. NPDC050790]
MIEILARLHQRLLPPRGRHARTVQPSRPLKWGDLDLDDLFSQESE